VRSECLGGGEILSYEFFCFDTRDLPQLLNEFSTSSLWVLGIRGTNALSRLEIFKWAIFCVWRLANLECLVLHKEILNYSTFMILCTSS